MAQIDRSEGLVGNTGIKAPVRAATTTAITLSGEQTIDGIACVTGDRVLVKDQSIGDVADNGIYVVSTGSWERADDFDGAYDVANGTLILVNSGTVNADSGYTVSVTDPVVIGSSAITFDLQSPDSLTNLGMSSGSSLVGFIQSGTGAVATTAQAKMREIVSVKDFGAVGDGVTDDTAAIQAAIDAHKGKIVYFPYGDYVISNILLSGTTYNNTHIIGDDAEFSFLGGTGAGISFANVYYCQMKGFLVRPLGSGYTDAIKLQGRFNTFIDIRIGFFDETPATWTTDNAWGYYSTNSVNGLTIYGDGTTWSGYNVIDNLTVKGIGGFGVLLQTADGQSSTHVNGNIFNNTKILSRNGVKFKSCRGNHFNNLISECTATQLEFSQNSSSARTEANIVDIAWMEYNDKIVWTNNTYVQYNTITVKQTPLESYLGFPSFGIQAPLKDNSVIVQDKIIGDAAADRAYRIERVWSKHTSGNLTLGSDIVTNGDMEIDANWSNINTPTTNEQSSTQAHGGTYSRRVVTDGSTTTGITQTITADGSSYYQIKLYIYPVTAALGSGNSIFVNFHTPFTLRYLVPGEWNEVILFDKSLDTSQALQIYCSSQANEFYVDDVSVTPVTAGHTGKFLQWSDKFNSSDKTALGSINYDGGITIPNITVGGGSAVAGITWNASATIADGGTVTHGLGSTPTAVIATNSISGEFVSVTALSSTTFTVAIKKHDNTAGKTQTIYWMALK